MGAPYHHAELSVKRFGGKAEDYLPIHELMDSSKQAFSDLRHRVLTHHPWFVNTIVEKIIGPTITNSDGKKVATRDIAQWHVMEDFNGSYPSVQDYLLNISFEPWMENGKDDAVPPSHKGLPPFDKTKLLPPGKPVPKTEKEKRGTLEKINLGKELKKALKITNEELSGSLSGRGCGGGGRLD